MIYLGIEGHSIEGNATAHDAASRARDYISFAHRHAMAPHDNRLAQTSYIISTSSSAMRPRHRKSRKFLKDGDDHACRYFAATHRHMKQPTTSARSWRRRTARRVGHRQLTTCATLYSPQKDAEYALIEYRFAWRDTARWPVSSRHGTKAAPCYRRYFTTPADLIYAVLAAHF